MRVHILLQNNALFPDVSATIYNQTTAITKWFDAVGKNSIVYTIDRDVLELVNHIKDHSRFTFVVGANKMLGKNEFDCMALYMRFISF